MAENILTEECPAGVADDVKRHWQKKLPSIERLLTRIPDDLRQLRFHFECDKSRYEAWAVLTLPTGTLVAHGDPAYHDAREAVDQVAERLAMEIRRHKEHVRHDDVYRRKARRRRDFMAIEPRLSRLRQNDNQKGFVELLRSHLQHLRDHARRELIIAQSEGNIRPGEVTVQDLIDDTIARAWDEWHQRPRGEPLDQWLVGLLHDVLDEREVKANGDGNAKDSDLFEANPDWPHAGENQWAVENNPYWPFADPLAGDETLPDKDSAQPWTKLTDDETRRLILNELKRFSPDQRRAFMLYALDGWTLGEIAQIQHRSEREVQADIEAVRTALRDRLTKAAA